MTKREIIMKITSIIRELYKRKMIVLLVAIVILFAILFKAGMFGDADTRIRVTCAGDSITYGSGVLKSKEIDSYPAQLQTRLGTSYLVSNFGLRNATASPNGDLPYIDSDEYKDSLESEPDVVVLMLGTNDAKRFNWDQNSYEKGLETLVKSYQDLPSKPVVYLMRSPYCFPIDKSGEMEYNINEKVVYFKLAPSIEKVAEKTGVEVIDLFTITQNKEDLYTDGVHFNVEGYSVISDAVYDVIKKLDIDKTK